MTKLLKRQARRARGGAKKEGILEQDVDRLSGEPARLRATLRTQACRSGVSAVAVEAVMNKSG